GATTKYVSVTWKSIGGEARMIQDSPPNRKVARNPIAQSIGVSKLSFPRHIVPSQLKNFTPVGTAMSIVITAKNGNSTAPVAYMWCAHTVMESAAIAIVANTSPLYPKIGLRENAGKISETIPKNGRAMMYTSGCTKNQNKC